MDVLLCRYKDLTFFYSLDAQEAAGLFELALEHREEEKAWQMWLMKYQHMTDKNFIPFSQFYTKATQAQPSKRSAEEILAEAEEIRRRAAGR